MNKIEQLLLDTIDSNGWMETEFKGLHTFENSKSFVEINVEIVSGELAKATKEIAIKFANWIGKNNYILFNIFEDQSFSTNYKYQKWGKSYINLTLIKEDETFTIEKLFDEFLKTL
jgi:hypothetical protein